MKGKVYQFLKFICFVLFYLNLALIVIFLIQLFLYFTLVRI